LRIAIIMRRHPRRRASPIMPEVIRYLRDAGVHVDVILPEDGVTDLGRVDVEHDLYVLKSGTDLALSLAGALDGLGASILNSYLASVRCRDKVIATRIMQAAGVPSPETFLVADLPLLRPLLEAGPLVVKPYRGSGGEGVRVVRDVRELNGLPAPEGLVFAQRYLEPEGRDRKIYRIGDEVFGVKRVWPPKTYQEKLGEPYTPGAEEKEIAMQCDRAFGMKLYGLDIVMSAGHPYVVDISSFPGFKGVPEAPSRLGDHILAMALRSRGGDAAVEDPGVGFEMSPSARR
jgi:ribosomal protein S6--L-glutamate ligase